VVIGLSVIDVLVGLYNEDLPAQRQACSP